MKNIVIIPCRMGSKGITRKNLQKIGKDTLLSRAVKAGQILSNEVYISSESNEIKKICIENNWHYLKRPVELAGDFSTDFQYIDYHITNDFQLKAHDCITLMRPTSPLRTITALLRLKKIIHDESQIFSSIRSVIEAPITPYKMWYEHKGFLKKLALKNPDSLDEPFNSPRQKLPKIYWQTGTYDVYRRENILDGKLSGENILSFKALHPEIDVDTIDDLENIRNIIQKTEYNWL